MTRDRLLGLVGTAAGGRGTGVCVGSGAGVCVGVRPGSLIAGGSFIFGIAGSDWHPDNTNATESKILEFLAKGRRSEILCDIKGKKATPTGLILA